MLTRYDAAVLNIRPGYTRFATYSVCLFISQRMTNQQNGYMPSEDSVWSVFAVCSMDS